MVSKCKYCGEAIVDTRRVNKPVKIYCSESCGKRYNAKKNYKKLRNNPEFKARAYKRLKKWIKNNKEKNRTYMRNYMNNVVGQKYYWKHRERNRENHNRMNSEYYHRNKLWIAKRRVELKAMKLEAQSQSHSKITKQSPLI